MNRLFYPIMGLLIFPIISCSSTIENPRFDSIRKERVALMGHQTRHLKYQFAAKEEVHLTVWNPNQNPVQLSGSVALQLEPDELKILTIGQTKRVDIECSEAIYFGEPRQSQNSKNNLLLVSMDTLRADAFNDRDMPLSYGFFGEQSVLAPTYTPTPWTLPAHASLLFSSFPTKHGVQLPDQHVAEGLTSLAQQLRNAGYITIAMTEGNYVSSRFGLDQGFDFFVERWPELSSHDPEKSSVIRKNAEWIRDVLKENQAPVFIFWHSYEVHCPYVPHGDLKDEAGWGQTQSLLDMEFQPKPDGYYEELRQLYLGEVAYADQVMYDLFQSLDQKKWIVSLVSDHGDEFGEHGGSLHADTLFEEVVLVPWALKAPNHPPFHKKAYSLLDLAPTLCAVAGVEPHPDWQGNSVFDTKSTSLFLESYFFGPHIQVQDPRLLGLVETHHKLIQKRNFEAYEAMLFDLKADPKERNNIQAQEQKTRDRLYQLVEAYSQTKANSKEAKEMTEAQAELLQSLGYVETGQQSGPFLKTP